MDTLGKDCLIAMSELFKGGTCIADGFSKYLIKNMTIVHEI